MEIKINKEIRNYYEQFLMGMSLRNVIFAVAGIAVALILGFNLRGQVDVETLSWVIPVSVVPFFFAGFKKINGMYMEKFLAAWFKSELLIPKRLVLREDNIYRMILNAKKGSAGNDKKENKD